MQASPGSVFVVFFIFGWAYYMVATILMQGSIFEPLRNYIAARSSNKFFRFLQSMLGCLMCTATEAALWTLGLITLVLGTFYHFPETAVSAIVGRTVHFPWFAEVGLMAMASFALSLAVAGEAWAIKMIFEHRQDKFLRTRGEFQRRLGELLKRLEACEMRAGGDVSGALQPIKELVIPKSVFMTIFAGVLTGPGCTVSCPFARTECQLRKLLEACRTWWTETNGTAPGFICYERFIEETIIYKANSLYELVLFWNVGFGKESSVSMTQTAWQILSRQVESVFVPAALQ